MRTTDRDGPYRMLAKAYAEKHDLWDVAFGELGVQSVKAARNGVTRRWMVTLYSAWAGIAGCTGEGESFCDALLAAVWVLRRSTQQQ